MKKILVIGAGRSTGSLLNYLNTHATQEGWTITLADYQLELAESKAANKEHVRPISLDVSDEVSRKKAIEEADLVVSMLPAHMHIPVATDCVALKKHMVTASYISPEMRELNQSAIDRGVILMNEIGVDPGVDHLSAMKIIDQVRDQGGKMLLFESFTGGLVAPESDDNPWNYKFTWNPRNVVLAGSGGAVKFKQEGTYKYIPYSKLFRRTEFISIEGYGRFEGYANRDSLMYRSVYGLRDIPTIYRGTLRRPGFCRAWDVFVKLGMTDDTYAMEHSKTMTHRQFINSFLPYNPNDSVELKLMHSLAIPQDSDLMEKLTWLDLFTDDVVGLEEATPAQILQHILEKKWSLSKGDKDMIVMFHKLGFEINGEKQMIESYMITKGEDEETTAMAKTVGLPVAMATKLILNGTIHTPGVHLPITKEIYQPMLKELESLGISFVEQNVPYQGY